MDTRSTQSGGDELKVGELAERTGVSIRTLHHYDDIGLLRPSRRTAAGHRLYDVADLLRLQQIVSLRRLGLSLDEIQRVIERPETSPLSIIEAHLAKLRRQMELERKLCDRLEVLAERLRRAESVSADQLLTSVEMTVMIEKYYTPEQLKELEDRRLALGDDAMQSAQQEWMELIAPGPGCHGTRPGPRVRARPGHCPSLA